jgi:hypothetical protein
MASTCKNCYSACLQLIPLILSILFACGCSGGSANPGCPGEGLCPPPPVISVSIQPGPVTLAAGGATQFDAKVLNSANQNVIWEVDDIPNGNSQVGTISLSGLYTAPANLSAPASERITAVAAVDSSQSASVTASVLAAHRIGVRPGAPLAEFFERTNSMAFTPRGNNYIRLATLPDPNGNPVLAHSTFAVGLYDANRAETALSDMQAAGYNTVRVFLEGCCQNTIGDPAGGLSSVYISNVVDFLQRARAHGIYVMITMSWLPVFGGYGPNCPQYPQFDDINLFKLCPGAVPDSVKFFHDFVQALIQKNASLDAVFAYELDNEYYYNASKAPLTWTNGTITTANGQTYDMGSQVSRQQMMDDGLVYFTDQMRNAIMTLDPTALVTVGFFVPRGPNPTRFGDPRVIAVYPAMANSTADFVDLHAYPIPGDLSLAQIVQNYGFMASGLQQVKPVAMAEFGGFLSEYATAADAASGLTNWQVESCTYNFKGWLLWTWDTDEQPELWNALSSGGAINLTLAPASRPNPCSP